MPPPDPLPALVITGMHRSGTSLVASLCHGAGLHVGHRLMAAGNGNDAGHFEDLDFVALHERILSANGLGSEGFTADALPHVPERLRDEALALVTARRGLAGPWGWKDPRTVLLLDFWAETLPEARFLLVFRPPWEVADSLFRRGDPAFFHNPPLALAVWNHYDRLLLGFAKRHPDRCLVRALSEVIADPAATFTAVRERLAVPLADPPVDRYRDGLLTTASAAAGIRRVRAVHPAALDTYRALQRASGGRDALAAETPAPDAARLLALEWARAAAAERRGQDAAATAEAAERRLAEALRERDAARDECRRLDGEMLAAAAQVAAHEARVADATGVAERLRMRLASWEATATDIQAALESIDRFRGDGTLARCFADRWPRVHPAA